MHIFHRPPKERTRALLLECELPIRDLDEVNLDYFLGCGDEKQPDGVIGMELYGSDALLRSLAVADHSRQEGCGRALVEKLEEMARSKGVKHLYLLTETAEDFFGLLGYRTVNRGSVSERITNTREFSSLCPADAAVMRKSLDSAPPP